jgi:DDE superfamily endonuclease
VYWPSEAQKRLLALLVEDRTGITGTWGPIVDGTDAYFLYKPTLAGDSWVGRKGRSGFNRLRVVDANLRVVYAVEGYGASVADAVICDRSDMMRYPGEYFPRDSTDGREDCLFSDVAFTRSDYCCPMFKGDRGRHPLLRLASGRYNSYRVNVEHSIGVEKARFPSLRALPVLVACVKSHMLAVQWCMATTVLHNICLDADDHSYCDYDREDIVPPPRAATAHHPTPVLGDGKERTTRLIMNILDRAQSEGISLPL